MNVIVVQNITLAIIGKCKVSFFHVSISVSQFKALSALLSIITFISF